MKFMILMISYLFISGCSSTKKEKVLVEEVHKNLKKDYVVLDSSHKLRPGWVEDASLWARDYGEDRKTYAFFSYETEPKVSREMSCHLAKANTRAHIASVISTYIDKSLAESTSGSAQANDGEQNHYDKSLAYFVENTLVEKINTLLHGAEGIKTYWEKRSFKKKLGAKKDYTAFTCAALIRIPREQLQKAIDGALELTLKQTETKDSRAQESVKKALESASEKIKEI
jgi:hypothetical protein